MNIVWEPLRDSSQLRFLECLHRFILFSGTRGNGKTEAELVKFHMHTGQGWGADWRGIIIAKQYKNLDDIVAKGKKLFLSLGVGIEWKAAKDAYKFVWPDGAELLLRVADKPEDYWQYHGHAYPFVCWEELTKWATPELYDSMKSINRTTIKGMPRFYMATTNPFGAGHSWVKQRFIDPKPNLTSKGSVVPIDGDSVLIRFDGDIMENHYLVENDPEYIAQLEAIENEALRMAWRFGSWDINAGSYFHGYLSKERNMVKPFIPPLDWPRWRAFDWGSAKPYSIGYWTMSPDGVMTMYREIYGDGGKPDVGTGETWDQISAKMAKAEEMELKAGCEFRNNPADHNLWTNQGYEKDLAELFYSKGQSWVKANKGKGSRINGWSLMKQMFRDGLIQVTSDCGHWWRTVPNLMPNENDWEDIDTDGEDHSADQTRYAVVSRHMASQKKAEKVKEKTNFQAGDARFEHLR